MEYKKEIKNTKGQEKLLQYLEDLKRNIVFIENIEKIGKLFEESNQSKREKKKEKLLLKAFVQFDKQRKKFKKMNLKYQSKINQIRRELSEEYGIDLYLSDKFFFMKLDKTDDIQSNINDDFCTIRDDYEEILENDSFNDPPIEFDTAKTHHILSYPVSINIHKFASKRDVLDFIEKRWKLIDQAMEVYRFGKKARFRKRKIPRKLTDFIWNNKDLPIEELKKELDKNFVNNCLVYNEIYKIIGLEKKRRTKKITVGQ